jgi:hypothetical protein
MPFWIVLETEETRGDSGIKMANDDGRMQTRGISELNLRLEAVCSVFMWSSETKREKRFSRATSREQLDSEVVFSEMN